MIRWSVDGPLRMSPSDAVAPPRFVDLRWFTPKGITRLRDEVEAAIDTGQPVLPIRIRSFGGNAYHLLAAVDILDSAREHVKIATIVEGAAMSAAAFLFSCGDFRFVSPHARVMVHEVVSSGTGGKVHDVQADSREGAALNSQLFAMLDKNTGKDPGFWHGLVHKASHADLYLSARKCLQLGLATEIGTPDYAVHIGVSYAFGVPAKPGARKAK